MKDTAETLDIAATTAPGMQSRVLLGLRDADLRVEDIMTDEVVCAVPSETVLSAVKRMSEHSVSCVIVLDVDTVAGILTERDVLRAVAAEGRDATRSKIAESMSRPVVSVTPDSAVLDASAIIRSKGIKRLAVVRRGRLLGLVTQTDITRGLISLSPFQDVADIMSTDVVTADASATVAEVAGLMSSRNISCVVAMRGHEVVGIMTEKDVLKRVVALHRDPGTTLMAEVMSHPLVASSPGHSILCAGRMMDRMRIHRLVVKDDKQVRGIVSQTDILDSIRKEFEEIREAQLRHDWEVRRLTDSTARNLSAIESLVKEALGIPRAPDQLSVLAGTCENVPCGSLTSMSDRPCRATALDPILTSLENLISESKGHLEQIAGTVQGRHTLLAERCDGTRSDAELSGSNRIHSIP